MRARQGRGQRHVVGERDEVVARRPDGARGGFEQLEHVDAEGDDGAVGRRGYASVQRQIVVVVVVVEVPGACDGVEVVDDAREERVGVRFVCFGLVGREGGSVWEGEGGWGWGAGGRRRDGGERGGGGDGGEVRSSSNGGDEAIVRFVK